MLQAQEPRAEPELSQNCPRTVPELQQNCFRTADRGGLTMGLFLDTLALKTDKNEYFRKTFGRSRSLLCKCFESRGGYNNVKSSAFRSRSLSVIRTRSNREQKEEATAENAHQFFLQANLQLATPKRFTSAECTRAALAATTRRARTPDRRRVALRVVCLPREQGTHALDRKN